MTQKRRKNDFLASGALRPPLAAALTDRDAMISRS
jgi:hypothetical protein